jgi:anti-sigma factor RsiW
MKWECALLQKWLPEYPDGDLPSWGKRWLKFHLARCSACQHELGELREVVATIEATPVADPPSEFWHEFSRGMHLKLVQAAQDGQAAPVAARPRWLRLPYLLGAPAVAVLLLYVAVQLTGPGAPVRDQALVKQGPAAKMAAVPQKAPAPLAKVPQAATLPEEQFSRVSLVEGDTQPLEEEADLSGWELDAELAGMTDQEKDAFLKKLHQHKKDGSCIDRFSAYSWG